MILILALVPARLLLALAFALLMSPLACTTAGSVITAPLQAVTAEAPLPNACNGDPALCDRRYDEVVYATTHNAMSASDRGFWNANQQGSLTRQLHDGVRALMLDTHRYALHPWDKRPWLCHRFCALGGQPLVEGLGEIKRFLDAHPREVVSIIFESHVDAASTQQAFVDAGLQGQLHVQDRHRAWPTLREMIGAGRRLVVFTDREGGAFPGYLDEFTFAFENSYAAWKDSDFACGVNRGQASNALFVLNHFISDPLPDREAAARVNRGAPLWAHAARCARELRRVPNFVTVDHYDVGDVMAVVHRLNRRTGAVVAGR